MVNRIMTLDEKQVVQALEHTLREFASRHRNISRVFLKHCTNIHGLIEGMEINYADLSAERKMLIGSYCTMEYAIESAAFFNPSIVEDFDQLYLEKGEKRDRRKCNREAAQLIRSDEPAGENHAGGELDGKGCILRCHRPSGGEPYRHGSAPAER